MFDRDTWRFINSFAPWLPAVGTLTAVIVSLYLGRRAARLDVRVFPAIVSVGVPGQQPWVEYFHIRADPCCELRRQAGRYQWDWVVAPRHAMAELAVGQTIVCPRRYLQGSTSVKRRNFSTRQQPSTGTRNPCWNALGSRYF